MLEFINNSHSLTRTAAQKQNINKFSAIRTLKHEYYKHFKIHLLQEVNEEDFYPRVEICEIMMNNIGMDPNLLNIVFSN